MAKVRSYHYYIGAIGTLLSGSEGQALHALIALNVTFYIYKLKSILESLTQYLEFSSLYPKLQTLQTLSAVYVKQFTYSFMQAPFNKI